MKPELFFSLEKTKYIKCMSFSLSSICTIYGAPAGPMEKVRFLLSDTTMTVSALDVVARLTPIYPKYTITNLGPTECKVFKSNPRGSPLAQTLKALLLLLIMFFGGAVAIMTFHEDVDMPRVHSSIYEFFTGQSLEQVPIVSIPYSIGIAVGFIVLFGLYKRKKGTATALDIDIHKHENDLREYLAAKSNNPDG